MQLVEAKHLGCYISSWAHDQNVELRWLRAPTAWRPSWNRHRRKHSLPPLLLLISNTCGWVTRGVMLFVKLCIMSPLAVLSLLHMCVHLVSLVNMSDYHFLLLHLSVMFPFKLYMLMSGRRRFLVVLVLNIILSWLMILLIMSGLFPYVAKLMYLPAERSLLVLVIEWQPRWINCVYVRYTGD